jgi:hypothetical protein
LIAGGELYQQQKPVRPTLERECGLWPTPRANKVQVTNQQAINRVNQTGYHGNLEEAVAIKLYPTPQANEDAAGCPGVAMQKMLGNDPRVRGTTEEEWLRGTLNPTWVEWLMGWPLGWTDLKPLAMDKCHCAPPLHGKSFQEWLDINRKMLETFA